MAANSPERLKYRDNAKVAFTKINCRVYGKRLGLLGEMLEVNDYLLGRGEELMLYCEAYDWLKASAHDPELIAAGVEAYKPYDQDRNGTSCMARNNLRLFARNFYIAAEGAFGPIENVGGWKKNHGIRAASAIGMAAIVLNDAGVETSWLKFAAKLTSPIGWVWGIMDGFHVPAPNYSPVKWHELGEKCWENLLVGEHWWPATDVPQTNADGSAGYAEGPGYFNYAMELMLPYVRTYNNWGRLDGTKQEIVTNMLTWQKQITTAGNDMPTYDDTEMGAVSLAGLFPESKQGFEGYGGNVATRPDFCAVIAIPEPLDVNTNGSTVLLNSGNAILRAIDKQNVQHYCHLLFESGDAVDKKGVSWETSHDHADYGSFMLSVGGTWLAIDPPYIQSNWSDKVNQNSFHNIFKAVPKSTTELLSISGTVDKIRPLGFTLSTDIKTSYNASILNVVNAATRSLDVFNTNGRAYYMLNDKLASISDSPFEGLEIFINGNGSNQNGENSFVQTNTPGSSTTVSNGRVFKWSHPCSSGDNWGLVAHTAAINPPGSVLTLSTYNSQDNCIHGSGGNKITNDYGEFEEDGQVSSKYGIHSRMEVSQTANGSRFQTLLLPYRCLSPDFPDISRIETADYVATTLRFYAPTDTVVVIPGRTKTQTSNVSDTIRDFHLTQMDVGIISVGNPFNSTGSTAVLESNAERIYMSRSDFIHETVGACTPSYIGFKQAQIENGTYVEYDDTLYIDAAMTSAVHYQYAGKFRYSGYVTSATGTSVRFFLPDLQAHFKMQGKTAEGTNLNTIHYEHSISNDTFKFVSIVFPQGTTNFIIELADPCAADCYFPPTATTIDSLFLFDTGRKESLGHDLDIVQGAGNLNITKGSRMSICPDFVLVNKDSITMRMGCAPEKRWIVNEDGSKTLLPPDTLKYLCNRDELLKDRAVNDTRNMIIINNKAGLVLDSGSVTHIGLNSTILIRSGGTLLVKRGAIVIIGDSDCVQNRGELLADHGAFVCIEEGAIIKFYNDIDSFNFYYKDTLDRHLVYIAMPKGSGKPGAVAGVNVIGGRGKFDISQKGMWSGSNCIPFCALKDKNPPHGINNRPFGWCNIGLPRAHFKSADTLCIGKPFSIDATHSLNETGYTITVCKYDTGSHLCITYIDSITDNGDNCLSTRYLFTPTETGYYRVRLIVRNDCNQTDTFTKILYVPHLPIASITLSEDSICPGIGSLYANGSLSTSNIAKCKHRWTIEPILEDSMDENALYGLDGNRDWLIDSLTTVDSSFNFPGYHFTGGVRYLISLTVWGWCSDSTVWDTVAVPLKVKINMEAAPATYANPVGPSAVRLKGVVLNATSWNWSPTDYLDYPDSLNPIASPMDSIRYILTGTLGGCSISDTITIRHNTRAFAGEDRSVCFNKKTVLGTDYNGAAMIGLMNYKGGPEFWDRYSPIRVDDNGRDINVQKYLTQYAIDRVQNSSSPYIVDELWNNHPEIRTAILNHPKFPEYFASFINTNGDANALDFFVSEIINADADLKTAVDNLVSLSGYYFDIESYFTNFESWYMTRFNNSAFIDINWEKKIGTSTAVLSDWRGHYNILVDTRTSATYRMTVIDNSLSIVEYDEVTVLIDTATIPRFDIAFQIDSTLYITNLCTPNPFHTYEWSFGDGSSNSTQFNAIHTFPAMDSVYVVCLKVTNSCDSYMSCDSVSIDSTGLIRNGFGKRSMENEGTSIDSTSLLKSSNQQQMMPTPLMAMKNQVLLDNIPNPFTHSTVISYIIAKEYTNAEVRISDVLGRIVNVYPIRTMTGKLEFDGSPYNRGLYYSSLIVDGVVVKSKTMLIER